jgi:hypothetical protein
LTPPADSETLRLKPTAAAQSGRCPVVDWLAAFAAASCAAEGDVVEEVVHEPALRGDAEFGPGRKQVAISEFAGA